MDLFKSGNPTLSEKIFNKSITAGDQGVMTARGAINKFGFLFLMVIAGAAFSWHYFYQGKAIMPLMLIGALGGLVVALVITFKRSWAPFLAPAYGILEGLFLGAISAFFNEMFRESYPGIIMQAVGLTMGVAIAMFILYNFGVIKATQKFKSIVFACTAGIAIFYLINIVMSLFGVNLAVLDFGNGSLLGIGISLFIVVIAALNLIMDFDMIEQGQAMGAPKYMEWYCAFGLMVTIVWLYIEMLRLLSRFSSRD